MRLPANPRAPFAPLVLFLALLALSLPAAAAPPEQYWQLVFSYGPSGIALESASPIEASAKIPTTPGLAGAPSVLEYNLKWLDGGGKGLHEGRAQAPIGLREAPTAGRACEIVYPETGVFVLRVVGPAKGSNIKALEMKFGKTVKSAGSAPPPPILIADAIIPFPGTCSAYNSAGQGPVGAVRLRNTGPDGSRFNFVILGDGYTQADLDTGSFTTAATSLVNAFGAKSPWIEYFPGVNATRIDVVSAQSGMDTSTSTVTTFFNAALVSDRLIVLDGTGSNRAICAADQLVGAGLWDQIIVLANSTIYGGSGGAIAVASVHPSSAEVMIHEVGHSFAGLADEYTTAYPGYPAGDGEPNVDYNFSGTGLKWLVWVLGSTPLPTPQTTQYENVVGAFEGARYLTTGIYRPMLNCEMRGLGLQFCPICKEAHVRRFHQLTPMIDGLNPTNASSVVVPAEGKNFQVIFPGYSSYTFEWYLNGVKLPATASTCLLEGWRATSTPQTLSVTVTDATALVRQEAFSKSYNWTVVASTATATASPTPSLTPSKTPSLTPSLSPTPSLTATKTPSFTPSKTPSLTPSLTPTVSLTVTKTPSLTPSKTPSLTPSLTPTVSLTVTKTPSLTPSKTPSLTPTVSLTPSPSLTPSLSPTLTAIPSKTPRPTHTPRPTRLELGPNAAETWSEYE